MWLPYVNTRVRGLREVFLDRINEEFISIKSLPFASGGKHGEGLLSGAWISELLTDWALRTFPAKSTRRDIAADHYLLVEDHVEQQRQTRLEALDTLLN